MNGSDSIYAFVFRGLMAEQALDATGRPSAPGPSPAVDLDVARRLSIDQLDEEMVSHASRMAAIYTAIAAFENSVRRLISTVLTEKAGAEWWDQCVSEQIRKKANSRREEESKIRWHAGRGYLPLSYTEFSDLAAIMSQNWIEFEPFVRSQEWARQLFSSLERSRNVIMHSGELELEDIERIGGLIRDWVAQVGS